MQLDLSSSDHKMDMQQTNLYKQGNAIFPIMNIEKNNTQISLLLFLQWRHNHITHASHPVQNNK